MFMIPDIRHPEQSYQQEMSVVSHPNRSYHQFITISNMSVAIVCKIVNGRTCGIGNLGFEVTILLFICYLLKMLKLIEQYH